MTTTTWEMNEASPDRNLRKQTHQDSSKNGCEIITREEKHLDAMDSANSTAADSFSTSTSEDMPQCSAGTPRRKPKSLLLETVSGMKEAASDTFQNVKEWATSPKSGLSNGSFLPRCFNPQVDNCTIDHPHNHTLTSLASMKSPSTSHPTQESSSKDEFPQSKPNSPSRSLIQDFVSPFFACSSYAYDQPETQTMSIDAIFNNMKIHHKGIFDYLGKSDIQSFSSTDYADEETLQLHRLTSWGTNGTVGTETTLENESLYSARASSNHGDSSDVASCVLTEPLIQDDDGNVIPPELIEHAQRRKEQRRTRKKRIVQFHYPPISSLRECPRANREDLPDLFFTERELDEIEADRSSANIADDVEIVAVASPSQEESISSQEDRHVSSKSGSPDKSFASSGVAYALEKRKRPASPYPRKALGAGSQGRKVPPILSPPDTSSSRSKPKSDARLLKGVQIYLRERSSGQCR